MLPVMRFPEGHKQAMREHILEAAAAALLRNGLAGIGIPALMNCAGLTHRAFQAHLLNRDALVAKAMRTARRLPVATAPGRLPAPRREPRRTLYPENTSPIPNAAA
ncbi:MAG: hypothetical protein ER33_04720 [Cyanobium sp. CACIAM 14]|nr:MAG: hypothetical protein ER33_04720 [Cyanobium sp. CACIAM 14]